MMGSSFAISLPSSLGSLLVLEPNIAQAAESRLVLIIHTTMPSLPFSLVPRALFVFGLVLVHTSSLLVWRIKEKKRGVEIDYAKLVEIENNEKMKRKTSYFGAINRLENDLLNEIYWEKKISWTILFNNEIQRVTK